MGDRRQRPCPPDVRNDVLDDGLDLLGRELVGDRPARRPADHAEPLLLVESIDLDDDAVGLVREGVSILAPGLGEDDDALDVEARLAVRIDREAEGLEALQRRRLGIDLRRAAFLQELVRPGREQPVGRNSRILLAERTGPGVARIGVKRQPGLLAFSVDPGEL